MRSDDGLERTAAEPSFLRERVWGDRSGAASPLPSADPHPALRATFSQWEKDQDVRLKSLPICGIRRASRPFRMPP
jgi:hypothetical protein